MFKTFLSVLVVVFFTGCDTLGVKVVEKEFYQTDIGTIKEKKLIEQKKVIQKEVQLKNIDQNKIDQEIKDDIKKPKKPVRKTLVSIKKDNYKKVMVPIVTLVYKKLQEQYENIKRDIKDNKNKEYIELLKKEYKAKNEEQLLHALKPHPISIVLAQGAIESAWLTSRFCKTANNIFGVWSFNKDEPRIAASGLRGEKVIYLKKYKTLKSSVEDYYKSIAKSWAYKKFRYLRTVTNNPHHLLPHMKSYSEKGEKYTKILSKMIKSNNFEKYDIK